MVKDDRVVVVEEKEESKMAKVWNSFYEELRISGYIITDEIGRWDAPKLNDNILGIAKVKVKGLFGQKADFIGQIHPDVGKPGETVWDRVERKEDNGGKKHKKGQKEVKYWTIRVFGKDYLEELKEFTKKVLDEYDYNNIKVAIVLADEKPHEAERWHRYGPN